MTDTNPWLTATITTVDSYRRMVDAALQQVSDQEFFQRPRDGMSSVAVILRHLGGNLRSRWTNFLVEDGEKPDRDRDSEFEDWTESRAALMNFFDDGWSCLVNSLNSLSDEDLKKSVLVRGESHPVPLAIQRSIAHTAYHIGQLLFIARLMRGTDENWKWLTIPPQKSAEHNAATWGRPASRGAAAQDRGGDSQQH
jgi:hypothetical protein